MDKFAPKSKHFFMGRNVNLDKITRCPSLLGSRAFLMIFFASVFYKT